MFRFRVECLVVASLLSIGTPGLLQGQEGPAGRVLRVATKVSPPFSMKSAKGDWTGLSIDLWRKIASDLELEYQFVESDLASMVRGLGDGSFDVAVGALTITFDREQSFDFTHAFYSSGLGIATTVDAETSWSDVIFGFFNWDFMQVFLIGIAVLIVCGLLVWLVERRRNPAQFGGGIWKGIGGGFWWSIVTATTVGYGDKAPVTAIGRVLAVVWMLASVLLLSVFTGALASAFTVSRLLSTIDGPDDLPAVTVGTVENSTSERYLEEHGIGALRFASVGEALTSLRDRQIDAVVYDRPILRHMISTGNLSGLHVLPHVLEPQNYGIGLAPGSVRREAINRALLRLTSGSAWRESLIRYLGTEP